MTAWLKQNLGEVCLRITDGKHGDCQNYPNSGYYFISSKDVFNGAIHYENARQITQKDFIDTHKRTRLEVADILITNSGTIGRMAFVKNNDKVEKTTFQKSVAILKPNSEKIDNKFLYYFLLSKFIQLTNLGGGAAQHNLLLGDLRKFAISIPSKQIQLKISSVVSSYDDLIENNEKRIKILEEMAQRLYAEWFVKFKFPGHEKVKMVNDIPEGWNMGKLGEKITIKKGKNITKKTITLGDIPVVAGGMEPAYYHNQFNTSAPVITISASGANSGFINVYYKNIWASDCSYINEEVTPYVFYYYLFLKSKQTEIDNLQRGAAQPHVYPKDLMSLGILKAPDELIGEFNSLVYSYFSLIASLHAKNINLTKTRDLLIPQLVTGKRELKD